MGEYGQATVTPKQINPETKDSTLQQNYANFTGIQKRKLQPSKFQDKISAEYFPESCRQGKMSNKISIRKIKTDEQNEQNS